MNPGSSKLPETSLEDATWGKFQALYDFTTSTVQSGYTGVTAAKGSLASKGWEWTSVDNIKGYYRSTGKSPVVDLGFITGSEEATLKLQMPYAGKYSFTVTVGDPQGTIVAKDMTISSKGELLLSGINGNGGKVQHYLFAG